MLQRRLLSTRWLHLLTSLWTCGKEIFPTPPSVWFTYIMRLQKKF